MTLILHYFTKWCTLRKNSWRCCGKKSSRLVSHLLMSIVSDAHIKEVVKVLWHRAVLPLQTVQSYSPGGTYVPLAPPGEYDWTCASFAPPPRVHSPNGKSFGSAVFAQLTAEVLILYNGLPFPQKLPLPIRGSGSHLTRFLGPIQDHNPNGISIGSAISAGLTNVIQTDRPRYLVGNNRPHLST